MVDEPAEDTLDATPHAKVMQGCGNLIHLSFVGCLVLGVWVVGTCTSMFYAFTSADNSWVQSIASEIAATFLLFAISPILLSVWKTHSGLLVMISMLTVGALLAWSWFLSGAWQQFAIGVGCGILLVQFLDYLIKGGWEKMNTNMERRIDEVKGKSTIIIGQ